MKINNLLNILNEELNEEDTENIGDETKSSKNKIMLIAFERGILEKCSKSSLTKRLNKLHKEAISELPNKDVFYLEYSSKVDESRLIEFKRNKNWEQVMEYNDSEKPERIKASAIVDFFKRNSKINREKITDLYIINRTVVDDISKNLLKSFFKNANINFLGCSRDISTLAAPRSHYKNSPFKDR